MISGTLMVLPTLGESSPWGLWVALFFASALYASVGHGGASAYLVVMGFAGMMPSEMKPIALSLNLGVSLLAMVAFARQGHFRKEIFWPLAVVSVPAAFLGGWLQMPDPILKVLLALALLCGAWRLAFHPDAGDRELRVPSMWALLGMGFSIGLVSGLVGIGGGIFLTPLLIFFRWSGPTSAAAISAAFILLNSAAGLSGFMVRGGDVPLLAAWLMPTVLLGGWLGARWGSRHARIPALQQVLSLVLVVAAIKFVMI